MRFENRDQALRTLNGKIIGLPSAAMYEAADRLGIYTRRDFPRLQAIAREFQAKASARSAKAKHGTAAQLSDEVEGRVAMYGFVYHDWGNKEPGEKPWALSRGCFGNGGIASVGFRPMHASGAIIARTADKTLTLDDRPDGLYFKISGLTDTADARTFIDDVKHQRLAKCSMEVHLLEDEVRNGVRYVTRAHLACIVGALAGQQPSSAACPQTFMEITQRV